MILVPYDGSADAQAAITRAGLLAPGAQTTVLTVWAPFIDSLSGTGAGVGLGLTDAYAFAEPDAIDAASREAALATATEGAQRAVDARLAATPLCESRDRDVASTILGVAADLDADLIVMGTRGLGGVMAFMLGSVSHAVVRHADRAVLLVPSSELLQERRHGIHRHVAPA